MTNPTAMHQQSIITSTPNLRDAGGYATQDGGRVRSGLLYRSEQLSKITDADMLVLEKLGLKKIYDLRTVDERAEQIDRIPVNAAYVVVDVLADEKGTALLSYYTCCQIRKRPMRNWAVAKLRHYLRMAIRHL